MATIEHAVLKSTMTDAVEMRNIFSAEITEVGADSSELMWDVYMTAMVSDLSSLTHTSVHYYGYDVYQLNAGQWELIDSVAVDADGVNTGEALLNAAAWVLIGKAPGIRHLGRKFVGGLSEVNVNANVGSGSIATLLAQALLDYISPVNGIAGGSLRPGVVDKNGGIWIFTGGVVSNLLGTMRRRKPGIGI